MVWMKEYIQYTLKIKTHHIIKIHLVLHSKLTILVIQDAEISMDIYICWMLHSLVVTNDRINRNASYRNLAKARHRHSNYNLSICIDAQEWIVTFYLNGKTMVTCSKWELLFIHKLCWHICWQQNCDKVQRTNICSNMIVWAESSRSCSIVVARFQRIHASSNA